MNKTISVNIGGFVFNIEEEAYQKLYQYLSAIKKNFKSSEDREEIMHDIEQRIAEIFKLRNIQKEVIVDRDIDFVIETMGKPEDYVSEGFEEPSTINLGKNMSQGSENLDKRLFRDTENSVLGGVCSGLSQYLNIDVTVIRLLWIFVAIFLGFGILIYLILFFVVPEAKTTADKLQMKGQSVTVESIIDHFNKLKNNINENTTNGKFSKALNDIFYKGISAGSLFVKIIAGLVGFALLVGGLFVLPVVFTVFFGHSGLIPLTDTEHGVGLFTIIDLISPLEGFGFIIFIALILVVLIPIISMIMTGAKVLFGIKTSFKTLGICMGAVWFVCFIFMIISSINLGMDFRNRTAVEYTIPCADSTQELLIDVNDDDKFSSHLAYEDVWNHSEFIKVEGNRVYLGYPKLNIVQKEDSSEFEIILHKKSNGLTSRSAVEKAEHTDYKVDISGNRLSLSPYFSFPKSDKFRNQIAIVEVRVPKGKKIRLGNNIDRINVSVEGSRRYGENSFSATWWISKKKRLECVDCKQRRHHHDDENDE
jgi:phage shock protein PspC (stress-responsive transcriptional regulator)